MALTVTSDPGTSQPPEAAGSNGSPSECGGRLVGTGDGLRRSEYAVSVSFSCASTAR